MADRYVIRAVIEGAEQWVALGQRVRASTAMLAPFAYGANLQRQSVTAVGVQRASRIITCRD
jgi:hypothetical protein